MPSPTDEKNDNEVVEYHGWYSAKQERILRNCVTHRGGSALYWRCSRGSRVVVTCVSRTLNHGCNTEHLDDLVYQGIVVKYDGICRQ